MAPTREAVTVLRTLKAPAPDAAVRPSEAQEIDRALSGKRLLIIGGTGSLGPGPRR